jgi:hypothetical protein
VLAQRGDRRVEAVHGGQRVAGPHDDQIALGGIGLSTDLAAIRTAGWRPLVLGGLLSLLVAATTLTSMGFAGCL